MFKCKKNFLLACCIAGSFLLGCSDNKELTCLHMCDEPSEEEMASSSSQFYETTFPENGSTQSSANEDSTDYSYLEDSEFPINQNKPIEISDKLIEIADIDSSLLKRAKAFRNVILDTDYRTRNAVYVYSAMEVPYNDNPEKLAARIAILGFKDIYLNPGKTAFTNPNTWIRSFISTCTNYGIKVYAQQISVNSANYAAILDSTEISDNVSIIARYNSAVKKDQRVFGISTDIEPHVLKSDAANLGLIYFWGNSNAEEDTLLLWSQNRLGYTKYMMSFFSDKLTLSGTIDPQYDIDFNNKKNTYGSSNQFLKKCDWVILKNYYTDATQILENAKISFDNSSKNRSISIALKVKGENEDSFQNWKDLLSAINSLQNFGLEYKNDDEKFPYRGIDFFSYDGLENLWNNK